MSNLSNDPLLRSIPIGGDPKDFCACGHHEMNHANYIGLPRACNQTHCECKSYQAEASEAKPETCEHCRQPIESTKPLAPLRWRHITTGLIDCLHPHTEATPAHPPAPREEGELPFERLYQYAKTHDSVTLHGATLYNVIGQLRTALQTIASRDQAIRSLCDSLNKTIEKCKRLKAVVE
jgi:hypothetical protein